MHDLPSQCKSEGSPGHGQTGEDNFGEGLVRLSVNRVYGTDMKHVYIHNLRLRHSNNVDKKFQQYKSLKFSNHPIRYST